MLVVVVWEFFEGWFVGWFFWKGVVVGCGIVEVRGWGWGMVCWDLGFLGGVWWFGGGGCSFGFGGVVFVCGVVVVIWFRGVVV